MKNKRDFYYFKISEIYAGRKFNIGDGYGILKIDDKDIEEKINMTGYYYLDGDGRKVTTDEEFWDIENVKQETFYFEDSDEEVDWNGAYVDKFYEYWDGYNYKKIWLDSSELSSDDIENVTNKIGKLKIIGENEEQTYNEYAYVDTSGNYFYKQSGFFVGEIDFLEETDFETLKNIFQNLELE